jgi:tape measure domain-containing protein
MALQSLNYIINLAKGNFEQGISKAKKQTQGLDDAINKVRGTANMVFGGIALAAIQSYITRTTELSGRMEGYANTLRFASKDQAEFGKNQKFVDEMAMRLGLDIEAQRDGFASLSASMKSTNMEGQKTRDLYTGLSVAMRVSNRSTESQKLAMAALIQMQAKGKVTAEELVGQLSEHLPNGLQIAARAMGIGTEKLLEMSKKGELLAQDFLPKLSAELMRTFGPGLADAMESPLAQMQRQRNEITLLEAEIGQKLLPTQLALLKAQAFGIGILEKLITFYDNNRTVINSLAVATATAVSIMAAYNVVMKLSAIYTAAASTAMAFQRAMALSTALGVGGLKAAWIGLNIVMAANPIGAIITALAALGAGFYYAYQNSDKFRAGVAAALAMVKLAAGPIIGLGKIMMGLLKGDAEMMKDGMKTWAATYNPMNYVKAAREAYDSKMSEELKAGSKPKDDALAGFFSGMTGSTPATAPAGAGVSAGGGLSGSGSGSGGGTSKNITINITKLVDNLTVQVNQLSNLRQGEVQRMIESALIGIVNDTEAAL